MDLSMCMRWHFRHIIMEDIFILRQNSVWAEYKNIKIEDYSEMYNSDVKGWIPKREDIEYDFEYREKEEIIQYGHGL